MVQFRNLIPVSLTAVIIIAATALLVGCADRDEPPEPDDSDPSLEQAGQALNRAQAAMQRAGVDINFADIGTLGNLATILPDPVELGALEDQTAIQEAISAMYDVLDTFEQQDTIAQAPASPAQAGLSLSDSDQALVHIHLAYLYVLETVRILTREGWGSDRIPNTDDDLFRIDFPPNPELENLDEVYQFELTDRGQARFDAIDANPSSRPQDYLKEFRRNQRQAVLDALVLLLGAVVKVAAIPGEVDVGGQPILEQTPQVDRSICRRDALFHLEKALDKATEIAPDFADTMKEFSEIIAEVFAKDLLEQTSEWGFEVENRAEILSRVDRLIAN